ncbi:MAG: gliding motility-associated C-terminal domain-containing protein, partial [Bacteroidota bacterium]
KTGLDENFTYHSGSMTANGRRLLLVARDKTTGTDELLFSIQVNREGFPTGSFPLNSEAPVAMSDFAIDPIFGTLVSFDEILQRVVIFSTAGQAFTNLRFEQVDRVFGGLFFDQFGQLYGLGASSLGAEQSTIFKINKNTGEIERLQQVKSGRDTDACACPYTMIFQKTIDPIQTDGCSEVTIKYEVINRTGLGLLNIDLVDTLPEAFTIKEVRLPNSDPFINLQEGPGTNKLYVNNWNILLFENEVEVVADVITPLSGELASQAKLIDLFAAYGFEWPSDDPSTALGPDATAIEVLDSESYKLEDYLSYSCNLDTVFLQMPLEGEYLWSDGSTKPVLSAIQNGTYALTLTTDCFTVFDEIDLQKRTDPFFINLPAEQQVKLGTILPLNFSNNLEEITSVKWSNNNETNQIACLDCISTSMEAIENDIIQIEVTDQRGCIFYAEMNLNVNKTKKIYLPSAFSPNGDGVNDAFVISGDNGSIESFQILDRWGSLLFDQNTGRVNDESGWNGKTNGESAAPGIYYYAITIRFPDDEIKTYQGEVMLMR